MDDKIITADLILKTLEDWIKAKHPISANLYLEACMKLNILTGDESEKLFDLQQKVNQAKVALLEQGKTSASAKTQVEALDIYRDMLRQKAKIERIQEAIRISKIQSRVADNEYRFQQ